MTTAKSRPARFSTVLAGGMVSNPRPPGVEEGFSKSSRKFAYFWRPKSSLYSSSTELRPGCMGKPPAPVRSTLRTKPSRPLVLFIATSADSVLTLVWMEP